MADGDLVAVDVGPLEIEQADGSVVALTLDDVRGPKGDQGDQGPQGPAGADGADGAGTLDALGFTYGSSASNAWWATPGATIVGSPGGVAIGKGSSAADGGIAIGSAAIADHSSPIVLRTSSGNQQLSTTSSGSVQVTTVSGTRTLLFDDDARLSDQRTPSDGSVTAVQVAPALKPSGAAVDATEALRALGAGAGMAAPGAHALGIVVHGSTASTARPAGYAVVLWVGSVAPTNMVAGDLWLDTSGGGS